MAEHHLNIKSTKFWLAASSFLAASTFLYTGHIGESTWLQALIWILGLYGAGNVGATFAHGVSDKMANGRTSGRT